MIRTEWKTYLIEQADMHPSMEPQDVYKMMYQAAFGAEHLLQDPDAAYAYLQKEYEAVEPENEALYEAISHDICRVNLRAWKAQKLPLDWLFAMFIKSVSIQKADEKADVFTEYEEIAAEAAGEGIFQFSYEEFRRYARDYAEKGLRAVHHSEKYRIMELPAYRLVNRRYIRILPVLEVLAQKGYYNIAVEKGKEERKQNTYVVTIDGRCASGKSTMAQMLQEITGAGVIHMDDFFLPMELRSKERLAEPGGNVHYERFMEEVLPHLASEGAFSYRRFDCSKMQIGEERKVDSSSLRVIEGAYSHHPLFRDYADLKVFSHVEEAEQLRRIKERDGEAVLAMFTERWIPMEEQYFATYHTKENSDIIV
uniref:uridine kinase family protein n=1 Tax=Acetatifactor sp. TaxID=1872090 RepID=UPI00405628D5